MTGNAVKTAESLSKDHVTPELLSQVIRYRLRRQGYAKMCRLLATVRADNRLLARKNRRLTRKNRAAQQLIDDVSHDFRMLLTATQVAQLVERNEVGHA
jgi:hypothetical protein